MVQLLPLKFLSVVLLLLPAKAEVAKLPSFKVSESTSTVYSSIDFGGEEGPAYAIFVKAITGYNALKKRTDIRKSIITIIDFTKSANEKRLWVIDLEKRKLLYHCLTAHGKNSGEVFAHSFSNIHNSNKSSLGFFVTGATYQGKHGTSLKLKGMEPGINDQAESRAIVMHGADYVSEAHIAKYGRLGRSFGCPAVPMNIHEKIINDIAGGSCLFIFHSNQDYNTRSMFG
jgi:hypothetical protein